MNALHTWAHVQDLAECIDQSTNRRDIECALDDLEYRVEILNAEPCRPANALVERPRAEPGPSRPMSNKHLCYGMRRLNPFQGILQVSELGHARAVRLDDVRWEVQVRCAQPEHTWRSTNEGEPLMRYLRFGAWCLESGLRQVPLSPVMRALGRDLGSPPPARITSSSLTVWRSAESRCGRVQIPDTTPPFSNAW